MVLESHGLSGRRVQPIAGELHNVVPIVEAAGGIRESIAHLE